ncbi:MAG: L,D-transpeptidase family protein [Ardenticatenaceae bacterium]
MKRFFFSGRVLITALLIAVFLMLGVTNATFADTTHLVVTGETLTGIAQQYGMTIKQLAEANGLRWNSWVYEGQVLTIPQAGSDAAPAAPEAVEGIHLVQIGDTLYDIAVRNGTTVQALMSANQLSGTIIRIGQELKMPDGNSTASAAPAPTNGVSNPAVNGEKWIDVNLSTQRITAYEGNTRVYSTVVSTGLPRTPTVVGSYRVYVKYEATDMRGGSHEEGDYYYLRNVPYTMYFYRGYGIHGTYWHNNFGQTMSHGCVNLPTSDAQWFFNWAPVGTRVETHY